MKGKCINHKGVITYCPMANYLFIANSNVWIEGMRVSAVVEAKLESKSVPCHATYSLFAELLLVSAQALVLLSLPLALG